MHHIVVEHPRTTPQYHNPIGIRIGSRRGRAPRRHHLIVADDVAVALHVDPDEGILIGTDVFDDVALGHGGIFQPDPRMEATNRPILDRNILAVECVDAIRVGAHTSGQAPALPAIEVEYHIVRLDVDGAARGHAGTQVARQAVDALYGDDIGQ